MSLVKSKGMNFVDYSISLMYWAGLKSKNRPGKTRPAQKPKESAASVKFTGPHVLNI